MIRNLAIPVVLVVSMAPSWGQTPTDTPTASPTCNPTGIPARFEPLPRVDPTYIPGTTITLTIMPLQGDWPTTPIQALWNPSFIGTYFGPLTQTFQFPDPGPDTILITCASGGMGIRPDCPTWTSTSARYSARRFDYVVPTPTVSPTASLTETPFECVAPEIDCPSLVVSPPMDSADNPTSVTLEHKGVRFLRLETIFGGYEHPVTPLGDNRYLATGLLPDTGYVWYFVGSEKYCPENGETAQRICLAFFGTAPAPTPSPAPTAVPTPAPTPSPVPGNGWMITRGAENSTVGVVDGRNSGN